MSQSPLPRLMLAIISLALFMEALDTTILNTAIPTIAQHLQVAPLNLKIALISYLVSLAIFMPLSGWMADRFGARRVFMCAIAVFTLSSWWCGWSTSLIELVLARAVQGIGGAMMMPVGRLIIVRLIDRHDFISAMNQVIMLALIGPALGPLIGGFIVTHFAWAWIFWVNLPIGLVAFLLSWRYLPQVPPKATLPLDKVGFIWFGSGLAGLVFGLGLSSESSLPLWPALLLIVISLLWLGAYVHWARRRAHPFIRLSLFELRTFRLSLFGNALSRAGFGSMPFLIPLLLQLPLGYSAQMAGFMTALTAVGAMVVKTFSKKVIQHYGFRKLLIVNTAILALTQLSFLLINPQFPLELIALLTLIQGFVMSLQFSAMNPLAYAETSAADSGAAAGLLSTTQQIGTSISVALAALLLKGFADNTQHLTLAAFHGTFMVLSVVTLSALFIFYRLKPEDGNNLY